ncbi:hypothetical protein BaRGS_00004955 [Batillaria attramentaria]|uniref:Uncharacterized protein n=1 Tax=Batillaria attramentaria TaxID=370345 RepID=A0ABD0LXZ7_9CAEN
MLGYDGTPTDWQGRRTPSAPKQSVKTPLGNGYLYTTGNMTTNKTNREKTPSVQNLYMGFFFSAVHGDDAGLNFMHREALQSQSSGKPEKTSGCAWLCNK